ncbi:Os03g0683816 [Oryza sativa Japonica Group]|uniref:Os03g0683816 protein n=1 Tax=Oryza sativa subsp. japonica TaxID=39947 RepID=A0A0P0W2B7_ORYSJ|nr:hypothetical protein EE612_019705 [Oryza sativa]BAS85784.1 Os03g0683816 [Oryza sativa Japonica Group]
MSKTTSLRSECCFLMLSEAASSFALNVRESLFSRSTHPPPLPPPNSVTDAGRHPIGGSDVTPIRLAPCPYSPCTHTTRLHEDVGELVGGVGGAQHRVDVVVLHEVAGAGADHVDGLRRQRRRLLPAGHRLHLRLVLLEKKT